MLSGIASNPLDTDASMEVGYLMHDERKPSDLLVRYLAALREIIAKNPTVTECLAN